MIHHSVKILAYTGIKGIGIEVTAHFYPAKCFPTVTVVANESAECRHGIYPCNITKKNAADLFSHIK